MNIVSRSLQALEFPEILKYLAGFTLSDAGFKACLCLRPMESVEEIHKEAELFEEGRLWLLQNSSLLVHFPSLEELWGKEGSASSLYLPEELWALRHTLQLAANLRQTFLDDNASWHNWRLRCESMIFPSSTMSALMRCLSDDGLIKDSASPDLSLARSELRGLHRQCTTRVKDYATQYNIMHYLQDDFMTLSSDRYVLPLKANFKGRLQGVVHEYSQTGETCYFEPMFLVEINNKLQDLKRREREEERKVLTYLTSLVRDEMPAIQRMYAFLVDLDVLNARSALAACYDGQLVEIGFEERVNLQEAVHPLLALIFSEQAQKSLCSFKKRASRQSFPLFSLGMQGIAPHADDELFQLIMDSNEDTLQHSSNGSDAIDSASFTPETEPLTYSQLGSLPTKKIPSLQKSSSNLTTVTHSNTLLSSKKNSPVPSTLELRSEQHALIISGGNAGGKTVCLKTLGLISIMSRCALPCPVQRGSTIPHWHHVHAFIGDEQSLEDHVSTFTAQISHLASIWESLGPHDVVILDEFGAGTDPSQGAALAQAVIGCIIDRGAYAVAATHFPALKAYALSTKGVRSASVLFDPKTKKPLFRLVYEQVGASQALDVAREHGLPEEVLTKAEQYLLLSGEDTSALVERLNALAVEREEEIACLHKKQISFEDRRKKLDEKFEKNRKELFDLVHNDVQSVMTEWKKSRITHKQALKQLSAVRHKIDEKVTVNEQHHPIDIEKLAVGDTVKHISWGRIGQVKEIDARKRRVQINLDGVSLWSKLEDITVSEQSHNKLGNSYKKTALNTNNEPLSLQLDLRGKRADIAIADLEKFLDSAIVQGRYEVEVVHGRGTGVLRRELHSFLKDFPPVAQFRLAPENRGGDGMTIVELK